MTGFGLGSVAIEYSLSPVKYLRWSIALTSGDHDKREDWANSERKSGKIESLLSLTSALTINKIKNRLSTGYGLNYSYRYWNYEDFTQIQNIILKEEISHSIGFSGNIYYHLWRPFYIGLIYNPTIIKIKPNARLNYEHMLSLELLMRIF